MLLVADVGNTNTKIGIYDGPRLIGSWRLTSRREQTADEYGLFIEVLLRTRGVDRRSIEAIAISNVVPPVQQILEWMGEQYFGIRPWFVTALNTPMPLLVDSPGEVGPDRLVDAFAAMRLYGPPLIVVDFGTATTFDCITADGRFIGGVIMPGIRTASDELVRKTAKLPATELTPPERVIGRRTEECIRAGVLWGTADAVDGLIRRIRAEWPTQGGRPPYVVATGGLAPLVAPLAREIEAVQPDLTLVGLRLAATALGLGW
jgi:type III pantothenate kinase